MKKILVIYLLFSSCVLFAQEPFRIDNSLKGKWVHDIYTNICCYQFQQTLKEEFKKSISDAILQSFILDTNQFYIFSFKIRKDLVLPNSPNIILIEFSNEINSNTLTLQDQKILYPDIKAKIPDEMLYKVLYSDGKLPEVSSGIIGIDTTKINNRVDLTYQIYYISGYFFKDDIKALFFKTDSDYNNHQLMRKYLEIRYFNLQPQNISFKEDWIYFDSKLFKDQLVNKDGGLVEPVDKYKIRFVKNEEGMTEELVEIYKSERPNRFKVW